MFGVFNKFNRQNKKNKNGYFLIEAVVAISLVIIGFLAIIRLVSDSLSLNRVVSDQFTANYLALEGVEIVKNLIGHNVLVGGSGNWNDGFSSAGCYEVDYNTTDITNNSVSCTNNNFLLVDSNGYYNYKSGNPTKFKRVIKITPISSDEIKIDSIVDWTTRGGGSFEVNAQDFSFNRYF